MSEEFLTSAHAIEERIRAKRPSYTLYYDKQSERNQHLLRVAKLFGIQTKEVSRQQLKEYGAFHVALSIPAESLQGGTQWLKQQIKQLQRSPYATVLLLDGITDVHNIGAVLRSSALFDVDLVIYPERRSASGDNDIVARVSAGGSQVVNHGAIVNLNYAIDLLKEHGFWVYGAHMKGTNLREMHTKNHKVPNHFALILGAEGKGLSLQVRQNCDELLAIPTNERLNSLNVSVAGGILLYTLQAQRMAKGFQQPEQQREPRSYDKDKRDFKRDGDRPFTKRDRDDRREPRSYDKDKRDFKRDGDRPFIKRDRDDRREPRSYDKDKRDFKRDGDRPFTKRDRDDRREPRSYDKDKRDFKRDGDRPFTKRDRDDRREPRSYDKDKRDFKRDGDRPFTKRDRDDKKGKPATYIERREGRDQFTPPKGKPRGNQKQRKK